MNKLLILILAFCITGCTLTQEPAFLKLDDYKILNINKNELEIATTAYFQNPNDIGCEVVSTDIEVFVNGLSVSKVNQSNSIDLLAGNEFTIPLNVSIPTEKIIKDKNGILSGLLTTLMNKKIAISYIGIVTLKKAGIEFDIDIKGKEVLKEFKKF